MTIETNEPQPKTKKITLGSILKKSTGDTCTQTAERGLTLEDKAKKEIECYLQSPNPDADSNPLIWWREFSVTLSVLARNTFAFVPPAVLPNACLSFQEILKLTNILYLTLKRLICYCF